jgi:hypothetical protein
MTMCHCNQYVSFNRDAALAKAMLASLRPYENGSVGFFELTQELLRAQPLYSFARL